MKPTIKLKLDDRDGEISISGECVLPREGEFMRVDSTTYKVTEVIHDVYTIEKDDIYYNKIIINASKLT